MRLLVCPDSYKEALPALEVARSLEAGFIRASKKYVCDLAPIADGGEGTVDALLAGGGVKVPVSVTGPLGMPVDSFFGLLPDGKTAVMEMAAAAGIHLLTTTFGVGELILAAVNAGAEKLIIGIGGSATNDAGAGMAQALGALLLDESGCSLPPGGGSLQHLHRIDISQMDSRIKDVAIDVVCDVDNPLTGDNGASAVYGPQKGASLADVELLDKALTVFAQVVKRDVGNDVKDIPGAGAAGGLGAGLTVFCGAVLQPGFPVVARTARLPERAEKADWIITGEGRTDASTLHGKAVAGVIDIARDASKPCIAVSGTLGDGMNALYNHGLSAAFSIAPGPLTLRQSIARTADLLEQTAYNIGRLLAEGISGNK